ncbi:glycosyl transferase family A [Scytonema hofmannii PCC 7110]|uniref:Glycosyl transferase family A n=1 Tax=Scytonema hofmannii PCC 7110 TaxID=128403 RepID=A0A139X5L9_9CYAN|nr:glycosyltransferase family A protein [Scytonema hofmannii]KYC39999.1 glycosyl transferase family A [Scytonema hofmannii PCC 7110]
MSNQPFLTIVTATRGSFSDFWLEQLLKIKGDVQFILVYPPEASVKKIDDPRVEFLTSPFKGEVMQRFTGLINAKGNYVMALDDDDFAHPELLELTVKYFQRFPDSWVLRLKIQNINDDDEARIKQDWETIPEVEQLEICQKTPENPYPFQQGNYKGLLEVPIAPLDKPLDIRHIIFPWKQRTDQNGIHFENFNNRVWKTERVKAALHELSGAMKIVGALTWLPAWSLDRLLGLFVQAKFYQKDAIIGHAPPKPEQIRYIVRDSSLKETRLYLMADLLLVKCYPQYGYFWNLIFWQLYTIPRIIGKSVKLRFFKLKKNKTENTIAIEG